MRLISTACLLVAFTAVQASSISTLNCADYNPIVRNEADLTKLSTCGTMEGNIVIGQDFSGSFHLPGMTLIGNTLYGELGFESIEEITEISIPDLQFIIEGINLEGLSKLHTFSMPRLLSIGTGRQLHNPSPELTRITNFGGPLLNFSFPELDCVSQTWFAGNIGKIDMPKLKTARFMFINSTADFDCNALIAQLKDVDFRDGNLECHSMANINGGGNSSEDTESSTIDNSSYFTNLEKLATQIVLEIRRFVF